MKRKLSTRNALLSALLLAIAPSALASTTWYVDGAHGSDSNNCMSPSTACKTIGHAIALSASGDSVRVAAATYVEHLTIGINLNVIGSGFSTTIIDGNSAGRVINIPNTISSVTLSNVTIRNGLLVGLHGGSGAGIYNAGTLTINNCTITNNQPTRTYGILGGGIFNAGSLTVNNSTISQNRAMGGGGIYTNGYNHGGSLQINNSTLAGNKAGVGGGIFGAFGPTVTINKSTLSGNTANVGGGINSTGPLTILNSTISGNSAVDDNGGGIKSSARLAVFNSTFSGNSAVKGGNIFNNGATTTLQNSILANSPGGGNCSGGITSYGYNMSSDSTCNFHNSGDRNNTNPMLGPLQNNGGPTQTMALMPESPAIDAGNPSRCTDGSGHLLTTDQRGMPRPDHEDTGGCDMGAYERQTD